MSRIGYQPISLPSGVKVTLDGDVVKVEGPKAKLSKKLPPHVSLTIEGEILKFDRENESKTARSMHGLARSLVAGMVEGVEKGFRKDLEIIGVGYRAQVQGSKLTLTLGFSHPVEYNIPQGVTVSVENNTKLAIEGSDKQMVGEVAATIRRYKKPEPYKGKGIRYVGERVVIKEGKTVG
ncbi:MAG: 50S ribosomal protein L6 [Victivallales bacterium]|nr:50S ribosomal protein L6 [Victivallales bacterium]